MKFLKPIVFIVCLIPFANLLYLGINGDLGANPVETITHITGEWSLRILLATLCITPLRQILGWPWLLRIRRMLGLFAFFYVSLHLITYLVFDKFFDWADIAIDIFKRPYITVGFIAFLLMLPLAVTSNKVMIRKLKDKWKSLHAMIYPISVMALLHYVWLVKADVSTPVVYLLILIGLLAYRLIVSLKKST